MELFPEWKPTVEKYQTFILHILPNYNLKATELADYISHPAKKETLLAPTIKAALGKLLYSGERIYYIENENLLVNELKNSFGLDLAEANLASTGNSQDLLLFGKFGPQLFYIFCPSFCGQFL